jgi:hypothetical protein
MLGVTIGAEWFALRNMPATWTTGIELVATLVMVALLLADALIKFKRTEVDRVIFVEGSALAMQVIGVSAFAYVSLQSALRLPSPNPWLILAFVNVVQGACEGRVRRWLV